ncbi:glycosyltransferase family A protein, partial [Listeria monocytogenes]
MNKYTKNPLVSVIIPTYNVEEYIEECIVSIQKQTYENLEIVVVDDCSSDNTFEILCRLAKDDTRIKVFQNDKNMKICYSLNKALENSSGEYIVRMDGDDVSSLDRIEMQLNYLQKNKDIDL